MKIFVRCDFNVAAMLLRLYFSSLLLGVLLFSRLAEPAVIPLDSSPVNPSFVEEMHNITLVWTYTLKDPIGSARFANATNSLELFAAKFGNDDAGVTEKFKERFRAVITNSQAELTILRVQRSDQGHYEFDLATTKFDTARHEVELIVQYPAKLTNPSPDQDVTEGSNLQLVCEATGNPKPNITWTKVFKNGTESGVLRRDPRLNIININRTDDGTYHCTANNGLGNPDSHALKVNVLYPPKVVYLPSESKVESGQASLQCKADGNPQPSFTWTPCDRQKYVCNNSSLNILEVMDGAVYTCKVSNTKGSDSANTTIVIAGHLINVTLVITSESCTDGKYNESILSMKLDETISKLFNESIYLSTTVRIVRCGSLIVDLTLAFSTIVTEKSVLFRLQEAAKDGKLGEFSVDASSIKGTRPVVVTTTTPPISKTTPSVSDDKTWIIVGAVLGSLAAVAVIAGVAFWCVRKKKKNGGKGTKEVSDDDTARQGQYVRQGPSSAGDGLNNSGYVDAGSASNYANPSGLPPVKPGSKKENKQEKKGKKEVKQKETNQQQALPLYAQVDKSKKTPKAPVNTYDQVERSRKSQPGEVMYTQVEQVNPGRSMPRAAASPVRRPPAYDDTQYAELII